MNIPKKIMYRQDYVDFSEFKKKNTLKVEYENDNILTAYLHNKLAQKIYFKVKIKC